MQSKTSSAFKWITEPQFPSSNNKQFSMLSWNILIKNDARFKPWDYRLPRIQSKLLSFNSDIICLQECDADTFAADFTDFCAQNGYDFKLNNKSFLENGAVPLDEQKDEKDVIHGMMCTAILWKTNKFKHKYHDFRSKATVLLLEAIDATDKDKAKIKFNKKKSKKNRPPNAMELYLKESKDNTGPKWHTLTKNERMVYIEKARNESKEWKEGKKMQNKFLKEQALSEVKSYVFITNVHLEASGSESEKQSNKREMRFNQIKHSIERIMCYTKQTLNVDEMDKIQCIFCGDFNDVEHSAVHNMLTQQNDDTQFVHDLKLKNAYLDNVTEESKRKCIVSHWITKRLIDHFYYTFNTLKCVMCIQTAAKSVAETFSKENMLSDHLPIAAMFEYTENKNKKRKLAEINDDGIDGDADSGAPDSKRMKLS